MGNTAKLEMIRYRYDIDNFCTVSIHFRYDTINYKSMYAWPADKAAQVAS